MCRSEEKCQELMQQVRNAPREEEVERYEMTAVVACIRLPRNAENKIQPFVTQAVPSVLDSVGWAAGRASGL